MEEKKIWHLMGCVVLYVINGPYGLHTYQENKKGQNGFGVWKIMWEVREVW